MESNHEIRQRIVRARTKAKRKADETRKKHRKEVRRFKSGLRG